MVYPPVWGYHCSKFEYTMRLSDIIELTGARVVCGSEWIDHTVHSAFSSDLMSDVLTLDNHNVLLITGLANSQAIRTAEMADIRYIMLARNKKATEEMKQLARENKMVLMESPYSLFRVSGLLYTNGLNPVF